MSESVFFLADAAIVNRLGRELVAKQETALIELIKNAYDADAKDVRVVLIEGAGVRALEIRDDGLGMTREDLVDGFLRLASDLKVKSPISPKYKRQRAGRKGIGRFSAQRLGDHLLLETKRDGDEYGLRLTIDWSCFQSGRQLEEVPVTLETVLLKEVGTRLRIGSLHDDWSDAQIRRCWRGVLALQQPFPVAPVHEKPDVDPGFSVKFLRGNTLYMDEVVVADLQTEILAHMHAVIEMKVDSEGNAFWRISKNRFGEVFDWKPINHFHPEASTPPPYKALKNAWMKTYHVIFDPALLPPMVFTRVRDELVQHGGIKLYRNGFRVVPYGDLGNDWLGLDQFYSRRTILAPIANRNFFGVVDLRDTEGLFFEEHTSREGLIETDAFRELAGLASSVILTSAMRIHEERGRKVKAGGSQKILPPQRKDPVAKIDQIETIAKEVQAAVKRASQETPSSDNDAIERETGALLDLVKTVKEEVKAAELHYADEAAMLRFLATLGMTTAEFSHETGMTFDAFRFDFQSVFDRAIAADAKDFEFISIAERAKTMLDRLDSLTSYLNNLAGARVARGITSISLSKAIESFVSGVEKQAASQGVKLAVEVPPFDPLFTRPMHEAELASVMLNLYTNSIKALKRSGNSRDVFIKASRDIEANRVVLEFMDSGDGIPLESRERVFDAFFSSRVSAAGAALDREHAKGTGLGLWIVKQIIDNAAGDILVTDAPPGFTTCVRVELPEEEETGE